MGTVTFHVKCAIQNMENPIFLGVTGQCLKVKPVISYENYDGQQITLKSRALNEVRLKPVIIKFKALVFIEKNTNFRWYPTKKNN